MQRHIRVNCIRENTRLPRTHATENALVRTFPAKKILQIISDFYFHVSARGSSWLSYWIILETDGQLKIIGAFHEMYIFVRLSVPVKSCQGRFELLTWRNSVSGVDQLPTQYSVTPRFAMVANWSSEYSFMLIAACTDGEYHFFETMQAVYRCEFLMMIIYKNNRNMMHEWYAFIGTPPGANHPNLESLLFLIICYYSCGGTYGRMEMDTVISSKEG